MSGPLCARKIVVYYKEKKLNITLAGFLFSKFLDQALQMFCIGIVKLVFIVQIEVFDKKKIGMSCFFSNVRNCALLFRP